MKKILILPVLAALPVTAFAESDSSHIRPFVGYGISLASTHHLNIENDGHNVVTADGISFNDNNIGNFVFGIEMDDMMALSLNVSLDSTKTKVHGGDTTTEKSNEISAEFDIYLTRGSNFKPFVSLGAGYISWDGTYKTSGVIFALGIGCKQYVTDNVYLGANLSYNLSTEMNIKEVNGIDVDDITMRMTGFDLAIRAGYRF